MSRRKEEKKLTQETVKAVSCQFTMLPAESDLIEEMRVRYQKEALSVSHKPADIVRSEIVRAGIWALNNMSSKVLYKHLENLETLKEGRPKTKKD